MVIFVEYSRAVWTVSCLFYSLRPRMLLVVERFPDRRRVKSWISVWHSLHLVGTSLLRSADLLPLHTRISLIADLYGNFCGIAGVTEATSAS